MGSHALPLSKTTQAFQWLFAIQNVGFALWLYGSHFEFIGDASIPTWLLPVLGLFFVAILAVLFAQQITWRQLPSTAPQMLTILLLPYVFFFIEAVFVPLSLGEFLDNVAFVTTMTAIGAITAVIFMNATRGLIKLRLWGLALGMLVYMLLFFAPAVLATYAILNGRWLKGSLTLFGIWELIVIVILNVIVEYRTFLKEFSLSKK